MGKGITIDSLVIETTRRCNMACDHCLRGDAENLDMCSEYVDMLMSNIDRISTMTLSGGEPSLVPDRIAMILESMRNHGVELDSFYIATNGKHVSKEFVMVLLDLYTYCDDRSMCMVQVSTDDYHDDVGRFEDSLLSGLAFASEREKSKYVLNEGRAKENGISDYKSRTPKPDCFVLEKYDDSYCVTEGTLYLNCKGNIVSGCDFSYARQDENTICHVSEFTKTNLPNFFPMNDE